MLNAKVGYTLNGKACVIDGRYDPETESIIAEWPYGAQNLTLISWVDEDGVEHKNEDGENFSNLLQTL
jgi:hypothetical protein